MKHEQVICPRCEQQFECKVNNIFQCDCRTVHLTMAQLEQIREQYPDDCLCKNCLKDIHQTYQKKKI